MVYEYTSKKTVIVLSAALTEVIAAGVVGHICQSIGHRMAACDMGRLALFDGAGNRYAGISKYPVVILTAKPSQVNKLFLALQAEKELIVGNFASTMLATGHDDDLFSELAKVQQEGIDLFGVGLFGESEKISSYTRKFSIWKGSRLVLS